MPWQDVCLSVRLSHAGIVPKRLHISSEVFFHRRVAAPHHSSFFYTNGMTGTTLTVASNARGMKNTTFDQYLALSLK